MLILRYTLILFSMLFSIFFYCYYHFNSEFEFTVAILMNLQAIDFDPTEAVYLSNRSLCWIRMGQADHALSDARACRELRPDWAKACYREGAALRLLQV